MMGNDADVEWRPHKKRSENVVLKKAPYALNLFLMKNEFCIVLDHAGLKYMTVQDLGSSESSKARTGYSSV